MYHTRTIDHFHSVKFHLDENSPKAGFAFTSRFNTIHRRCCTRRNTLLSQKVIQFQSWWKNKCDNSSNIVQFSKVVSTHG